MFGFSQALADPGYILLGAQLSNEQDPAKATQAMLAEIEDVARQPDHRGRTGPVPSPSGSTSGSRALPIRSTSVWPCPRRWPRATGACFS